MIRITDSLRLTRTKFQTRKFRSIFAAFSLSLALIVILLFLIGGNGVISHSKKTLKDSLSDRYFAAEEFRYESALPTEPGKPDKTGESVSVSTDTTEVKPINPDEYFEKYKNDGVTKVYVQKSLDGYSADSSLEGSPETVGTRGFTSTDPLFVQDFLRQEYSFENQYDGKIPVILPEDFIINSYDPAFYTNLTQEEQYRKLQELLPNYIGKSFRIVTVSYDLPDPNNPSQSKRAETLTDIEVIVVGVSRSGFGSDYVQSYNFIVPVWATETQPTLKARAESNQTTTRLIYEFETKDQRDAFTKKAMEQNRGGVLDGPTLSLSSYIVPVFGPYEQFRQMLKIFRYAVIVIGGFFLVISAIMLMTTLGKIVNDSKQEIGIFRAAGAQKGDIRKIYFTYTFLLSFVAYILGLIISYILLIVASLKWSETFWYNIAGFGTTTGIEVPKYLFVSFPLLYLLAFFVFTLLFGTLASAIPVYRASRLDPVKVLRDL